MAEPSAPSRDAPDASEHLAYEAEPGCLGPASGGAELNTVLAEGGGTFPLDPDLEAKCDSSAVTARSRCVSGAAVRLSFCRGSPSSSAHQEDYDGNKRKILEIPLN